MKNSFSLTRLGSPIIMKSMPSKSCRVEVTSSGAMLAIRLVILVGLLATTTAYDEPYYSASYMYTETGNLALDQPSWMSSTGWGGSARNGNDGMHSGNFWGGKTCINTKAVDGEHSWWTVDLGDGDAKIGPVVITPRIWCDKCNENLKQVEIRLGDNVVEAGSEGDDNAICVQQGDADHAKDDPDYLRTAFDCGGRKGRFLTVRLTVPNTELSFCELMAFGPNKRPEPVLEPVVSEGACPPPLEAACEKHVDENPEITQKEAWVKAFMEGPIDCGGKGFFCRMRKDPAGISGGLSGTPGDKLLHNRNYGYCSDRTDDAASATELNTWHFGPEGIKQPTRNDGHCHGSDFDSSYHDVLHDHYYRPYRGTLECCCSLDTRDEDNKWIPAKDFIGRCDYRGENDNDARQNFENGCTEEANEIPKDAYPNAASMCWTLDHFGNPLNHRDNVVEKPTYSQPRVSVSSCTTDPTTGEGSCLVGLEEDREPVHQLVIASTGKLLRKNKMKVMEKIEHCQEVHGLRVSGADIRVFEFGELEAELTDKNGKVPRLAAQFNGCYVDDGDRAFEHAEWHGHNIEECAYKALKAGATRIALQYPQGQDGDKVQCFFGDKGLLGKAGTPYEKVEDSQCKGEDWNPTFFGKQHAYNGNGWRNAVYDLSVLDGGEISTRFRRLEGLPGKNMKIQVMDMQTCALSNPANLRLKQKNKNKNKNKNRNKEAETPEEET